ncbi:MAG: zf-HC2 domain-containing protein [Gemmatimonadota bacterium]
MSHVDDGTLHALVDDELDDTERASIEAHLATCGDCAKRFAEATAMARQVASLLGALDEVPAPVRIQPAAPRVADVGTAPTVARVTPIGRRFVTLRRVALAASVLLVAGVSYQVGQRRPAVTDGSSEAAPTSATAPPQTTLASGAAAPVETIVTRAGPVAPDARVEPRRTAVRVAAVPVASDRGDAIVTARVPTPVVAMAPRAEPLTAPPPAPSVAELTQQKAAAERQAVQASEASLDRAVQATGGQVAQRRTVTADAQDQQRAAPSSDVARAYQRAREVAPSAASANVVAAEPASLGFASPVAPGALAGYRATDEVLKPAVVRRRYVAADGTTLLLTIAPSSTDVAKPTAKASPEFTVSTVNGRSTVRWQVPGLSYELQGALSPDSLVKLATLLR